ncbi:hypothetical protein [Streptomyces sp. NPDC001985]|uniref:hypothetical protein n=1 Tax=Streptomyces sp. NPDC001985 TaxID=3154406 RepID=UPI003326E38C
MGAGGDRRPYTGLDEGPAVLDQAAGEVVVEVLGGEVADQVLTPARPGCEAGPCGRAGPVELAVQRRVRPRETAAPADHEQHVRHQTHQALQQAFQVAVPVGGIFEGVQQDHRGDLVLRGQPAEFPREQVRVVGESLQAGDGLQQRGRVRAAGQGAGAFAALPQPLHRSPGDLPGRGPAGQLQQGGGLAHRGLHLLGQRGAEASHQPGAPHVLVERFAGVGVPPVLAQGHVEGGQRTARGAGESEPDGEDDAFEVGAG